MTSLKTMSIAIATNVFASKLLEKSTRKTGGKLAGWDTPNKCTTSNKALQKKTVLIDSVSRISQQ